MEGKHVGAPSDMEVFDQILAEVPEDNNQNDFSGNSFTIDDILQFDFRHFDFDLLNSLPSSPPSAAAGLVSSEESNPRASGPVPEGPMPGLDHGKSVVVGDLGGAKGGGEKKLKRPLKSISVEACGPAISLGKRAMDSAQLDELARVDPKRAKRILLNRQSAAKSKEKKMRYVKELKDRVPQLEIQVADLSTNISMLQKETTRLTVNIKELNIAREAKRDETRINDVMNVTLKKEVWSLENETNNLSIVLTHSSADESLSQLCSRLSIHQF